MQVIKEVWLLQHKELLTYVSAQNTATPKLFVSEKSAATSALSNVYDNEVVFKPMKAFIVVEGDTNEIPF